MKYKILATAGALSLLAATPVSALSFTATSTGPITAYFYGQTAGYGSDLGLLINGVSTGVFGLYNHGTPSGTALVLGNANAGDVLTFQLRVSTADDGFINYSVFSDPSLNGDLLEHTVASAFNTGEFGIPNGTRVGFEDIVPLADSDFDFDDHVFVFTNVRASVPDGGATVALLGVALLGLGAMRGKLS
jgi:hypothetical protein